MVWSIAILIMKMKENDRIKKSKKIDFPYLKKRKLRVLVCV